VRNRTGLRLAKTEIGKKPAETGGRNPRAMPKIPDKRPRRAALTRGNAGGSRQRGKISQETTLRGGQAVEGSREPVLQATRSIQDRAKLCLHLHEAPIEARCLGWNFQRYRMLGNAPPRDSIMPASPTACHWETLRWPPCRCSRSERPFPAAYGGSSGLPKEAARAVVAAVIIAPEAVAVSMSRLEIIARSSFQL
jgi:hypothetical protein